MKYDQCCEDFIQIHQASDLGKCITLMAVRFGFQIKWIKAEFI